jgi:hypothetical protein
MKSIKNFLNAIFSLLFLLPFVANAQLFEGKVTFGITYDLPADQQQMASMMPAEHILLIKNQLTRMDQNTMGIQSTMIHDNENGITTVLMDMQGKKYKMTASDKDNQSDFEIEYLSETKDILGYSCKKALIKMGDDLGETIIYYTNELPSPKMKGMEKLDGFPLEYMISSQGMKIHYLTKEVKEEPIADSMFAIPEGYEEMPASLMEMFGN